MPVKYEGSSVSDDLSRIKKAVVYPHKLRVLPLTSVYSFEPSEKTSPAVHIYLLKPDKVASS